MEKPTLTFVNSLFLLAVIFLYCCKPKIYSNDSVIYSKSKGISPIKFDTAINKYILADTVNLVKEIGSNTSDLIEENFNKGECIILTNKNETEFFILKREYGGYKNQFDYFYLERSYKPFPKKAKKVNDNIFKSNKGAYLGMTKSDFLTKYADINFNLTTKKDTLLYSYRNDENIYQCRYTFFKDKLIKFEFGYQD